MREHIKFAIVGATGAVGQEVLKVLEAKEFPMSDITLFARRGNLGRAVTFRGKKEHLEILHEKCFQDIDIAIFSAGSDVSRVWAPAAKAAGCVVIDNSSAFRMDENVPLVVPEINAGDIKKHQGIIANPNCTTAITLMALYPLHKAFGVKRIIASSYQAVSGAGQRGIDELAEQSRSRRICDPIPEPKFFPHLINGNVFPQVDVFQPSGYTKEEEKMQNEGRKIMHHPTFKASVTCVRVPVYRAHSVSVCAEFEKPVSLQLAHDVLRAAPGVELLDQPHDSLYPTPLQASGKYDCFVGRIRRDSAFENGLSFFVCGDQLLKGAALNAVQIAECLIK